MAAGAEQRIFLAHAHEDKAQVRKLYADLKAAGFEPWLDEEDLLPGQNWRVVIPSVIKSARIFIACLSNRSVAKQGYVQEEFRTALAALGQRPPESIYVIPVKLDACEIPNLQIPDQGVSLRDLHWVPLDADEGFDRLLRGLHHALGQAAMSTEEREPPPPEMSQSPDFSVFRDLDEPWCPEMVVLPAGRFLMGSPKGEGFDTERPQHEVTIGYRLAIGRYPVTFEEYDRFGAATGGKAPGDEGWGRGRRPVINVSWEDAQAYVRWLGKMTGEPYRLLSEAEWEYAARAGTTTRYWWGDEIVPTNANYRGSEHGETITVGSYPGNPWGVFDMNGNVWERAEDCWNDSYEGAPTDGSVWTTGDCAHHVLRGGSWVSNPAALRSAYRDGGSPEVRIGIIGFRVARTLTS